ncbi:MAG: hypothetical protein ACLT40_03645 [Fusobacterium sp.]
MKMLINNRDFIFAEEKSPYRCISILIAEGKFFNLFPLYLVHKIVNVLLGGGTFNEDIYMFKEDNFKVVLITKNMHFYSQEDKNICEYELIFTGHLKVMLKAIKKFSKKREPRLSLLSYDELFEEIIDRLEKVM